MTAADFSAFVVTLAPPPAENLVFIDSRAVDIDTIREFTAGADYSPEDPQATFIMAYDNLPGPLSEHIFSCHSPAANTTIFVANGTLRDDQRDILTKMGYTVVEVFTDGRPIAECVMTKEKDA